LGTYIYEVFTLAATQPGIKESEIGVGLGLRVDAGGELLIWLEPLSLEDS
jgi:hypothetical protein